MDRVDEGQLLHRIVTALKLMRGRYRPPEKAHAPIAFAIAQHLTKGGAVYQAGPHLDFGQMQPLSVGTAGDRDPSDASPGQRDTGRS